MPVKYIGYDLLNRYGMIHKFKVPSATLETFLSRIEEGMIAVRCLNFNIFPPSVVLLSMEMKTGGNVEF